MFNSRIFRNSVFVAAAVILTSGSVLSGGAAKNRRAGGFMWAIPSKSLLCVRINKFDSTLDSVNAFLNDVAPDEADAKAARSDG